MTSTSTSKPGSSRRAHARSVLRGSRHFPRVTGTVAALVVLALHGVAHAEERTTSECPAIDGSAKLLAPGRVVLLGELHGTNESPGFVSDLACLAVAAGRDVIVGLELSASIEPSVKRFLASAGMDEDRKRLVAESLWQRDYQDGRTSRAMARLIDTVRRLRGHGPSVDILLFDAGGPGQERERGMAGRIGKSVAAHPEAVHLILTGNLHSRITKGSRQGSEYEPMGHLVRKAVGSERVAALDVSHRGGVAWLCTPDCGFTPVAENGELPRNTIVIDEDAHPSGHTGWYAVGSISASPPGSGKTCRALFEEQLSTLDDGYDAFDQSPDAGWRILGQQECLPEAVELIDRYVARHEDLSRLQGRILSFHAGQLLAQDGRYEEAIPRFLSSIDVAEPPEPTFHWNAYVHATVAFLDGDADELRKQREIVAGGVSLNGTVPNLDVVDRLIEGLGQGYRAAYSGRPRSTPTSESVAYDPGPSETSESHAAAVARWQGSWQAWQYGSRIWTLRIEGDRFHGVVGPEEQYRGTVHLRTEPEPDEIDFLIEECDCGYVGEASLAIFRLEDESILLATPQPGARRPTSLGEDPDDVITLKPIRE